MNAWMGCSAEELLTLGRRPAASSAPDSAPSPTSETPEVTSGLSSSNASSNASSETLTSSNRSTEPSDAGAVSTAPPLELPDAGDGDVSDASLPVFVFGTPVLVEELFSATKDDNPTLTSDMREIYFSSKRDANSTNLWWARRADVDEPFSPPELLVDLSSSGFDTSPAVDGDGLTFWFSSRVSDAGAGELDIFRTRRASRGALWGLPELMGDLNSAADDIPRPTGAGGLVMPLASRRDGDAYQTYFARRASSSSPFEPARLVSEIHTDGMSAADAFLSADGLTLLYAVSGQGQAGDLYVATRRDQAEPFSGMAPLSDLNTAVDERDPWLSPDGQTLYFASDRNGSLAIYRAERL